MILFYDGLDNDGKVSSFLIKRALLISKAVPLSRGRTIMTVPIWENGTDTKESINLGDLAGKEVIFADVMLDIDTMDYLASICKSLKVYDHHDFAKRDWLVHGGKTRCATKIVYDELYNGRHNELVEYVNDRDLFFKKLPDTDAVFLALQTATDAELEWAFANGVSRLIKKGKELQRQHMAKVDEAFKGVKVIEWQGFTVGFTHDIDFGLISDVGNKACRELNIDFYINRNLLDDGTYTYGLRSIKGNVLEICKKFGGGGHPSGNAGGFQTKERYIN